MRVKNLCACACACAYAAGITTGSVSGSVFSLTGSLKPLDLPGSLQVIAPDEEKQAYNWDDHDEQVWHVDSVQQQNSQGQNEKLERAGDNNNNNSQQQQQQQQQTLLHQGHRLVYVHIQYSKERGKHPNVLPMPAWRPLIDNRLIASTNRYFYKCTSTESSLFPREMFGRRPFCTTHFFEMGWAVASGYRHEPRVAVTGCTLWAWRVNRQSIIPWRILRPCLAACHPAEKCPWKSDSIRDLKKKPRTLSITEHCWKEQVVSAGPSVPATRPAAASTLRARSLRNPS